MKETIKKIWRVSPIYIRIILVPILLISIFIGGTYGRMSGIIIIYILVPPFIVYFLFKVLNLNGILDNVTKKQIHINYLIQLVLFLFSWLIWSYFTLPNVDNSKC